MTPFDLPIAGVMVLLFVAGACLGRWMNVVAERIPHRISMWDQWRACTDGVARKDVLAAGLPVLGPLSARGTAVFGSRGRGVRAAVVELSNGLLLALLYWFEIPADAALGFGASSVNLGAPLGPSPGEGSPFTSAVTLLHVRYAFHAILVESLLLATIVDFDLKLIPSITTDPFTIVGVGLSFACGWLQLTAAWFQDQSILRIFLGPQLVESLGFGDGVPAWLLAHPHWHGLIASLAGVVVGGGVVWLVRLLGSWAMGREAMGQGDVYLMMTVGAFLGWQAALVVFFLAPVCALGIVAVQWLLVSDGEIPYGPFLSLAALLVLLGWERIFPAIDTMLAFGPLLPLVGLLMGGLLVAILGLLRGLKWMLGIGGFEDLPGGEWTTADQTHYLAGENVDDRRGRWRTERWPGVSAGRGLGFEERWRDGR